MIPKKEWSSMRKLMVMGAVAGGKLVEATATGNPLTFTTEKAKPLRSLLIPFTPVQSGTGDPSPDNVRPIVGWAGVNVARSQTNLFPPLVKGVGIDTNNGKQTENDKMATTDFIRISFIGDKGYFVSGLTYKLVSYVSAYNAEKVYLGRTISTERATIPLTLESFTNGTPQGTGNIAYIRITQYEGGTGNSIDLVDSLTPMMNVGQSAVGYVPHINRETFETYPVTWTESGTIYGGTLDLVTGVLSVEWHKTVITGQQSYYTGANYIKSDACDAYFSDALTLPSGSAGYCNQLKKAVNDEGIWSRTGYPNYFRVNGRQLHFNIANDLLGITDYTQETQETAMAKIKAYLKDLYDNGTPLVFVTKLATPQTIQLDPVTVNALVGDNTIWSDTNGENVAVYLKKA